MPNTTGEVLIIVGIGLQAVTVTEVLAGLEQPAALNDYEHYPLLITGVTELVCSLAAKVHNTEKNRRSNTEVIYRILNRVDKSKILSMPDRIWF